MLAAKYRLAKQADFKQVFKYGRKGRSSFFALYFWPNLAKNSRIAVVCSLKVSKKAYQRNKLKRQSRAVIAKLLPKFRQNVDLIINISPPALNQNFADLGADLQETIKKFGLI